MNIQKLKQIKRKLKRIQMSRNVRLTIITILSILFIVSAYSAYATYQPSTTTEKKVSTLTYNHNGHFGYMVYLTNNTVYNTSILYPGQGNIFKKITDHIDASLTYSFLCDQPADIDGTYTLTAEIYTDMWTKEYIIIPQTTFSSSFNANFPINYSRFESIVSQINNETGVTAGDTSLIMKCNIDIAAETSNGSISESFTPSLNVSLGGNIVEIKGDLSQYRSGVLEETEEIIQPGSAEQSLYWGLTSILFLIIFIVFLVFTISERATLSKTEKTIRKIQKKYGEWIVETGELPTTKDAKIIPVKSLDDLIKISEELGKPVIHSITDGKHTFYVFDDNMHYQYILPPNGEKLKKTTRCPKCQTKITNEGKLGEQIHVTCPSCGAKGIVTFGKTNPIKRLIPFKKQ